MTYKLNKILAIIGNKYEIIKHMVQRDAKNLCRYHQDLNHQYKGKRIFDNDSNAMPSSRNDQNTKSRRAQSKQLINTMIPK